MNSSLPFSSKILLAWGKLTNKLLEPPAHSASENEKLLAQQENLLVLDNQTALFKTLFLYLQINYRNYISDQMNLREYINLKSQAKDLGLFLVSMLIYF